jgi:ribose transport system substrate-binding protein
MKKASLIAKVACVLLAVLLMSVGCGSGADSGTASTGSDADDSTETFKVGFANSSLDNPWRVGIQNAIEKNFAKYPEVELITNEAGEDPIRMNNNIEDLIAQGVDMILCCTVEAEPFEVSAKLCADQGIPLILVDRGINSDNYTCFISQSNMQIGYDSADWAADEMTKRYGEAIGKVVELQGVPGNLPAEQRRESFHTYAAEHYPGLEIVAAQPTDYSRANAMEVMENILQSQKEIDVVYTHEDEIALGAIKALQEAGRLEGVLVIGDGGSTNALNAIKEGTMAATATYSPIDFGYVAVETAMQYLNGGTIDKVVEFTGSMITQDNIDEYLSQIEETGEDFVSTLEK